MDTKLLEIGVVVRDSRGRAVAGLTKENFRIFDNGVEREVADFAVDSNNPSDKSATGDGQVAPEIRGKSESAPRPAAVQPRFIALLFDDLNANDGQHPNDLKQTKDAAAKLVQDGLQPGVKVAVFTASGAQTLGFTADVGKLVETIERIRARVRPPESSCPTPYLAYLTVVRHDAQALAEMKTVRDLDKDPFVTQCRQTTVSQAEETWRRARGLSMETLETFSDVADHLGKMQGSRVLCWRHPAS